MVPHFGQAAVGNPPSPGATVSRVGSSISHEPQKGQCGSSAGSNPPQAAQVTVNRIPQLGQLTSSSSTTAPQL
jgi:hypothetical protein